MGTGLDRNFVGFPHKCPECGFVGSVDHPLIIRNNAVAICTKCLYKDPMNPPWIEGKFQIV